MMIDKRWYETHLDTHLYLQFQDLTTVLSHISDVKFEFTHGSFIDVNGKRITGSSIWDATKEDIQKSGYKTDIYLRAIGTLHFSQLPAFQQFWHHAEDIQMTKFATQLVTLLEDLRLEEQIKRIRPGTSHDFFIRKTYLKQYFSSQLTVNVTRGFALDELFCLIYLLLQADGPDPDFSRSHQKQVDILDQIKSYLYESFSATTTHDVVRITMTIVNLLSDQYKDMINDYFAFPIFRWNESYERNTLFDELTRTDDVANHEHERVDSDNHEYIDETFSTWHRENKNTERKQTFLQMDLEVGTKTNLKGGGARETESGDQAFATAQGTSGKSKQRDYSQHETLEKYEEQQAGQGEAPYGDENINATIMIKEPDVPTDEEQMLYDAYVAEIEPYQRQLAQTIHKMIEHKKSFPRTNLHFGRLSKNLLPIVTEEFPRLFYKKDQESNEFDAVFTLMVDCSASMDQKMAETKRGIVLFHEVLKQLNIPHKIVGFWEEATFGFDKQYPNYFHIIHSFSDSLYENNGAKIMQLEPREDNRDGFSIRVITEKMIIRPEKHKFLLVFSDGEPAAADYEQNGIVDTNQAVSEARKQGIHVIGMYLADGKITEYEDKIMKNIYGRERLMVPDVSDLPELFTPVLKKLLLSTF